ncbi:MAG: Type 1 glutamine amidotransferase-like domain-containing protein [Candidatus Parcubacteria bacterium]|nr:Type 1 glutamine amidotransferase-like domain-containing protein [Candidatus Parcubacteria bacterium]
MQKIKDQRIYLSGGGNEKQSFLIDELFFNSIPKNGRFLYIPIALRGHKLYPTSHLWMKSIVEMHERTDIQFEVMDDPLKYKSDDLKLFNAVYIGGGNTWSLMKEFTDSGFSETLIRYYEDGGLIYGGSAGAIIFGKRIDTHDDKNEVELTDMKGFDLLHDCSVVCHFKDEQNDRFKTWAIDHCLPIVCLPEEAGIMIQNGIAICVGRKPCTVYSASGEKRDIQPEGTFFEVGKNCDISFLVR